MIYIQHKWGADYLVFDEPIQLDPKPITSPQGISIVPGQNVSQIGRKRRSSFEMKPGLYMTYEGQLKLNGFIYAIFNCPQHATPQLQLFGQEKQYRYAFTCVFVHGKFNCFLVGRGGTYGLADIQLDYIA